METKPEPKPLKAKTVQVSTVPVRVKRETKKRLLIELAKANKKSFGKKLRLDDLITVALGLVTEQHVVQLQEASLSNADRLEMAYREHIRVHGATTKDAFLGQLMSGKVATVSEHNRSSTVTQKTLENSAKASEQRDGKTAGGLI